MRRYELHGLDALSAADRLCRRPGFAFLDSAGHYGALGRHSFIGVDPFAVFSARAGQAFWNAEPVAGPPLACLRDALGRFAVAPGAADDPPFRGGAIGYIAYDFGRALERLAAPAESSGLADDLRLAFYDLVLAFDNATGRATVFSSGLPATDSAARAVRAEARLAQLLARLAAPLSAFDQALPALGGWRSNFTAESYDEAVERVKAHIRAGDIYQANIAMRFSADLPNGYDHWAFYRHLRAANPAPFAAYLAYSDLTVACSSPERFLRLADGAVETRPIKGTARRATDPASDRAVADRLAASIKDRAENVMIVDLLRNDLSRVSAPGSVAVPTLCGLETYASVHHLTSVVTGRLRDGLDGTDLLAAAFPGGSITGAPKLRAMDIIAAIEGVGRGVYCGAIGYLGFDGGMDLNVAIRTVALDRRQAVFHAGCGVTLLSQGADEYAEALAKAERIFAAFGVAADDRRSER